MEPVIPVGEVGSQRIIPEIRKPSPVEKVCSQIHEIMKDVSIVPPDNVAYNLQMHLKALDKRGISNLKGNIQVIKDLIGIDPETDGEAVEKELKKFIFPNVQPIVDENLLAREEKLTKVLQSLKKMFECLSSALDLEMNNMEKKYLFETFNEPIRAYHGVYHQYAHVFSWVEEIYSQFDTRKKSDQEKNASVPYFSYFSDAEQARNDTLDTLELTYTMEKGLPLKDLEAFHATTDKISTSLSNLASLYKGYNDFRALAERKWCKLTYLYIGNGGNGMYPDSYYNKFDKEYDENVPRDQRQHFYLNKQLQQISPKLKPNI